MKLVNTNEIFEINEEFHVEIIQLKDNQKITVINNLFKDWNKIRELFLETPAPIFKSTERCANFIDYYECRQEIFMYTSKCTDCLGEIIKHVYGDTIKKSANVVRGRFSSNMFMQVTPRLTDYGIIHRDAKIPSYSVITYLNTEDECSGGTAFFDEPLHIVEHHTTYWDKPTTEPLYHFKMKPGVTIIYDSRIYHAPWHPEDSFYTYPRLNVFTRLNARSQESSSP